MAEWAAANINEQAAQKQDGGISLNNTDSNKRRRTSETPEAALARLTTSYSTAMTAVGALHKASNALAKKLKEQQSTSTSTNTNTNTNTNTSAAKARGQQEVRVDSGKGKDHITDDYGGDVEDNTMDIDDESDSFIMEQFDSIKRVSKAARDAFENALLSDPLIRGFCPTFAHVLQSTEQAAVAEEASLSSAAHQNNLKELTYASLINYADLLISTCACSQRDHQMEVKGGSILDRGIVPVLKAVECQDSIIETGSNCVWHDIEQEDRTIRLALVAYCDACDLDGSDPTSWLKLACAARIMGKMLRNSKAEQQQQNKNVDDESVEVEGREERSNEELEKYINLDFERLERLAVERGLTSLKNGVPPNRALVRAFRELEDRQMNRDHKPYMLMISRPRNDSAELRIDLSRYSWSTLGRNLLRACREGVISKSHDGWNINKSWESSMSKTNDLALPTIRVEICPLFVLPGSVLLHLCQFLGGDSKNLESTCRSLSVGIISARAMVEKDRNFKMKQMEQEMGDMLKETEADEPVNESNNSKQDLSKQELLKFTHRTSKRVQSQLMSSGKQAERSAKRKSVEYCLTSSIVPCTIDHPDYRRCVNKDFNWDSLLPLYTYSNMIKAMAKPTQNSKDDESVNKGDSSLVGDGNQRKLQCASNDTASMVNFMKRWSTANSGARDMLQRFLAHISCHVSAVYESENGNTMVLTQCIMDCFDLLMTCNSNCSMLSPSWFGTEELKSTHTDNALMDIETFAINLLSTELKMRSCERHGLKLISFDDNVQAVRTNIPKLIHYAETLEKTALELHLKKLVSELTVRTYWLVSYFYVWYSRHTADIHEVKQLESLALDFLGETLATLESDSIKTVNTPHLLSPGRSGIHWIKLTHSSLLNYRDLLESSTVISRVRQKFSDCISNVNSTETVCFSKESEAVKTQLRSIEADLIERYQISMDGLEQNIDELISNFVVRYKDGLTKKIAQDPYVFGTAPEGHWGALWDTIPSSADGCVQIDSLNNPALLTIIFLCMQSKDQYATNTGKVLVQLLFTVLEKRSKALYARVPPVDNFAFSDDSDSSEDESEINRDDGSSDPLVLKRLALFLVQKLESVLLSCEPADFGDSNSFHMTIMCAIKIAFEHSHGMLPDTNARSIANLFLRLQPNQEMLAAIISISAATLEKLGDTSTYYQKILTTIFTLLVKSIIHSKKMILYIMSSRERDNLSRSECHPLIMLHAKFAAACATEVASLLTRFGNRYADGKADESFLVKCLLQVTRSDCDEQIEKDVSPLIQFAESLSWFWDFVYSAETIENPNVGPRFSSITNSVHKQAAHPLLVPIGSCICSLLGAVGHGPSSEASKCFSSLPPSAQIDDDEPFSLSDYFESDESAQNWLPLEENDGENTSRKQLLQTLSRTVQCIGLVFSHYRDKDLATAPSCVLFPPKDGFFLPLIVARSLSHIADFVLIEFSERKDRPRNMAVWEDEFPCGFRCAGAQLDLLLLRAYRCLHGISLTSSHLMTQVVKDAVVPPLHQGSTDHSLYYFRPESDKAAIRLYRCVMRSACNSRKRVPVPPDVFDCIRSALPKETEDEHGRAIKAFIFGKRDELIFCPSKEDAENIMSGDHIDAIPTDFPSWILQESSVNAHDSTGQLEGVGSDIQIVQKGIWQYLADSPLPRIGSNSTSNGVQYTGIDRTAAERTVAASTEVAVEKQLFAIINALRYDALNENKWFRAGLCIAVKLNLILDRLIPAERGFTFDRFSPPIDLNERRKAWNRDRCRIRVISKLLKYQRRAFVQSTSRTNHIEISKSSDLSAYMQHQFCSTKSFEATSHFLHRSKTEEMSGRKRTRSLSVHERGSCFVSALKLMRHRCFRMAMYLSKQKEATNSKESIYSHVAETFGTAEFDAISSSVFRQTMFERRRTSIMALKLFQASVDSLRSSISDDSDNCAATWEALFMIGKCCEKIANTLKEEDFIDKGERLYEKFMHQALGSYHTAFAEAKAFDDDGNSLEFQGGGSSHGLAELKYRVHATRLKLLIAAMKVSSEDLDKGIAEALRVSEKFWYKPETYDTDKPLHHRLWNVFIDTVDALASCRQESSFFHRSVYRHAQALLWAPIFFHPLGTTSGDSNSIPEDKACRIVGLQNGSFVESAESIISSLFDKKRLQLVAVWVTTPASPTPFETINDSARKFDRLRCKYIAAYIETMYLCKRKEQLETLIKWNHASPRDLPSFYDISLRSETNPLGTRYQDSHCKDNLLLPTLGLVSFTKKLVNAALCRILVEAMEKCDGLEKEEKDEFGNIYSCFLRLNCPLENSIWQTQQIRKLLNAGACIEVDSLITAYQFVHLTKEKRLEVNQMSWEEKMLMLRSAVKEGQKLNTSKDELDASKKARKKRKILDTAQTVV